MLLAEADWPNTDAALAMSLMSTLPFLSKSDHSSSCRLVVFSPFSGTIRLLQHLMYPVLRCRSTRPPAASACPPGLPLAFCVQDACPAIVLTPCDRLHIHAALPT